MHLDQAPAIAPAKSKRLCRNLRFRGVAAFAAGYARQWGRSYDFTSAYPLRSSDNQVRYLVHLANHDAGWAKFKEAWKACEDFGLLAPG